MKYIVYQHINPITGQVFYIGSGVAGREQQTGKYQRSALYHLYCKNAGLIINTCYTQYNVIIEVIAEFDNQNDALKYEYELVNQKYGTPGYQLVNSNLGFNNSIADHTILLKRSQAVSLARSKAVYNITDGVKYKSITDMAQQTGINRATLQKRIGVISDNPGHSFIDGINPMYINYNYSDKMQQYT